ncbi:MAG: cytochrome c [Verrucomicrobiota bacterium]|nr:cytochrome c [Verrucomicrobiota bacterium]
MLRYFFSAFFIMVVAVIALAGFRGTKTQNTPIEIFPDMDHQPKFQPQHPSAFFADGRAAREPVKGTVPMGYTIPGAYLQTGAKNATITPSGFSNQPDYFNTGRFGDVYGDGIPLEATEALLRRGQERFNINCAVCHGQLGLGNGIMTQYGLAAVANLQLQLYKDAPDGQLFSVITNGKNTMGAYGPQIAVEDRWAIVAYIRALQRSQQGQLADLPPETQQALQQQK